MQCDLGRMVCVRVRTCLRACVCAFHSLPSREEAANELAGSERPRGVSAERVALRAQIAMQVGGERCWGSPGAPVRRRAAMVLMS